MSQQEKLSSFNVIMKKEVLKELIKEYEFIIFPHFTCLWELLENNGDSLDNGSQVREDYIGTKEPGAGSCFVLISGRTQYLRASDFLFIKPKGCPPIFKFFHTYN